MNCVEKKRKKIGVLTYWNTNENYGQVLQCFALVKTLLDLGYDAKLVKYIPEKRKTSFFHKTLTLFKLLFKPSKLAFVLHQKKGDMQQKMNAMNCRNFNSFRDKHIPSIDVDNSLYSNPPKLDVFLSGSDQIWNGVNPIFFLDFVPDQCLKISYASSLGGFIPNKQQRVLMKQYLSKYCFVSVREAQSQLMLQQLDICPEAKHVPDPTLLLDRNVYENIAEKQIRPKKYILLYLLGNKTSFDLSLVKAYAKKKSLDIVYVASQGRMDSLTKEFPSIEEWLGLVFGAECVITNSYHGTIFSMIARKKFCTILLNGYHSLMNSRVVELLGKYGLECRIFDGSLDILDEDVNFRIFDNSREEDSNEIKKILQSVIGC